LFTLALLAIFIFILAILIGPIVFLVHKVDFVPNYIKFTISFVSICCCAYMIAVVPVPILQLFFLISIGFILAARGKPHIK
jgi:hypothetical protein